jgi:hypothetical protein
MQQGDLAVDVVRLLIQHFQHHVGTGRGEDALYVLDTDVQLA